MAGEQRIPNGLKLGNTSENSEAELITVLGDENGNGHRIVGYILRSALQGIPLSGTVDEQNVTGPIISESNIQAEKLQLNQSLFVGDAGDLTYFSVFDENHDGGTKSFYFSSISDEGGGNEECALNIVRGESFNFGTGNANAQTYLSTVLNPLSSSYGKGLILFSTKDYGIPTKGITGQDFYIKENDPLTFAQLGDIATENPTDTPLSLATLNSTYPTQPTGFKVICPVINIIYIKDSLTTWKQFNTTNVT